MLLIFARVFALLLPAAIPAFNLTPIYLGTENRLEASNGNRVPPFLRPVVANLLDQFADPAHESLTAVMFGCTGDFDICGYSDANPEAFVPGGVLDGLRWNDNPIFRVSTRASGCRGGGAPVYIDLDIDPLCWVTLFYDAGKRASGHPGEHFAGDGGNPPIALIYRVHYGDMQFLHSMASWDGETAPVTQAHILLRIEFTYELHDGEIENLDAPIVRQIPAFAPIFGRNGFSARSLMTPQAVPGPISSFYAYNHQDSNKHKSRDQSGAAEAQVGDPTSVIAIGKRVLALFASSTPWTAAAPYFACIFSITIPAAAPDAGTYAREG